jgi:hypothetical protein
VSENEMNLDFFIVRLSDNRQVFESLLRNVVDEQARWKPAPHKWSMLEVVNHLSDEEREDFRQRLDLTLHKPGQAWPQIAPEQWVAQRRYNERRLDESFANFLAEREKSLIWLNELSAPNWELSYERPTGVLTAGDLLASWLAHDFLHIRQLARLHWQYVGVVASPSQTAYGGSWTESP